MIVLCRHLLHAPRYIRSVFPVQMVGSSKVPAIRPEPEEVKKQIAATVNMNNVRFLECATNDTWARDHGVQTEKGIRVKHAFIGAVQTALGEDGVKKFPAKQQIHNVAVPRTLKATLRPYQQKGFSWMHVPC